jgi:hypothetical protein
VYVGYYENIYRADLFLQKLWEESDAPEEEILIST